MFLSFDSIYRCSEILTLGLTLRFRPEIPRLFLVNKVEI